MWHAMREHCTHNSHKLYSNLPMQSQLTLHISSMQQQLSKAICYKGMNTYSSCKKTKTKTNKLRIQRTQVTFHSPRIHLQSSTS